MNTQYEYKILVFELNEKNAAKIESVLNKQGEVGYIVSAASEFGGYNSTKKVMYTLMRESLKSYEFSAPKPKFPKPVEEERKFRSRANDLSTGSDEPPLSTPDNT